MSSAEVKASGEHISSSEATQQFLHMEEELGLLNCRIGGVWFWERVRFQLHRQILQALGFAGQAHTAIPLDLTSRIRNWARSARSVWIGNPYLSGKRDLLFVGHPRRKLLSDGKWWDVYCDPLLDGLDYSWAYGEFTYLGRHLQPAKTAHVKRLDLIGCTAAVGKRLGLGIVQFSSKERALLDEVEREITTSFGCSVQVESVVRQSLLTRKLHLPQYRLLLKKIAPGAVVLVVSYGKETLIEACKQLGIPVVELQHGVVNRYHLAYSFPGAHPTKRCFPDYFFAFGRYWKDCVDYPVDRSCVRTVGYPFLEKGLSQYSESRKRDQIIFISQGTVGKALTRYAVEASKSVSQEVILKLHPGEYGRWRDVYPWLEGSRVTIVDDDSVPFYQLLAESRIQVGVNSTAIYEGLALGTPAVVLNLPGSEYMDDLVAKGNARLLDTVEELKQYVASDPKIDSAIGDLFFEKGGVKNFRIAIEDVLSVA